LGEVETIENQRDSGLGITVFIGHKKGSASTSDLSETAIKQTAKAACDIAKYTGEDPCSGLAEKELMAKNVMNLELSHPWNIAVDEAVKIASECEASALDYDKRITNSEGATIDSHDSMRAYGNSHGFIGSYPTSRQTVSCSVLATDNEGMQRDYFYTIARRHEDLQSAKEVGRQAATRSINKLSGRSLSARQVPVVFSADMASGLMNHFVNAIRGSAIYHESSFLLNQLDQQVFPEFIQFHERPHIIRGLGSSPYDSDGVLTYDKNIVSDGILNNYVLDSYSAKKLKMKSTANAGGVQNILIPDTGMTLDQMLKEMGTGVLVMELMGQGINIVTGDYSRGASGFWVENGEIQYPVEEITIAGNLKDMYMGIQAISNDTEKRRKIQTGSIWVDKMTVAGE
jgi:PmbA protein